MTGDDVTSEDVTPTRGHIESDRDTSGTVDADTAEPEAAESDTGQTDSRAGGGGDTADSPDESLFSAEDGQRLRGEWDAAQTAFVDDPREAVERADRLVDETIQSLSTSFTQERSRLEEQWARGESVSTEDLRVALQRYRTFFERLLTI